MGDVANVPGWGPPADDRRLALEVDPPLPPQWLHPSRRTRLDRFTSTVQEAAVGGEAMVVLTLWWPPSIYHGLEMPIEQLPPCSCEVRVDGARTMFHPGALHASDLIRSTVVLNHAVNGFAGDRRRRIHVTWRVGSSVVDTVSMVVDHQRRVHRGHHRHRN